MPAMSEDATVSRCHGAVLRARRPESCLGETRPQLVTVTRTGDGGGHGSKTEMLTLSNVPRSGKAAIKRTTVGWRLVNPKATLFWKADLVGVHGHGDKRYAVLRIRRTSPPK
jgi:hypothetical protein